MMRNGILGVIVVVAFINASCAGSGKAVIEQYREVSQTRFEGAVAVVLDDRKSGVVDDDGVGLVVEGFRRIKLLDRKAMDCSDEGSTTCRSQRNICYNETFDTVEMIEARTINPDGQIIAMEKKDMSDRKFTTWSVPDQDQRCFVWTAKGAAPGAILEERWRTRSTKIFSLDGIWFQDRDPVLEASITVDAPANFAYKWKASNIDLKPTEEKVGNRIRRTWTARQVPPLIPEDGMVAPDDIVAKLSFTNEKVAAFSQFKACASIKTWEDLGNCWLEMINDRLVVSDAVREVAQNIAQKAKTETEKLRAVWDYMNTSIRYVGLESGLAGFIPLSAHVVCSKKYGDCKAVAGLISVLCRELGLKADPILIGIRPSLGQLDLDMPGPFHFNHSIARVEADGKVYWMDATYRDLDFSTTPAADQGVNVIVARPGAPFVDFIPVQPPESNTTTIKSVFIPSGTQDMELQAEITATGNTAGGLRSAAQERPGDKWRKWVERLLTGAYPQLVLEEESSAGKEDNNTPFSIKFKAKIPRALQPAGKGYTFEVKELTSSGTFDYFALPKRHYTLDIDYLSKRIERFEVKIPENLELAGQPKNIMFDDEFVKIERMTQIENDRVVTELNLAFKMLQIPPEKYAKARESFQKAQNAASFVLMFEPPEKKKK